MRRGAIHVQRGSGLVGGHSGRQVFLIQLLLPGGIGFREFGLRLVAHQVRLGLRHLRSIAVHRRFRLAQRLFIRTRIDMEQHIALFYVLAFGETHGFELPGDLRLHLHDGRRFHRSHHVDFGRHRFLRGFRHRYRHRRRRRRGYRGSLLLLARTECQQTHEKDRCSQENSRISPL
jgi:hypothetical protein